MFLCLFIIQIDMDKFRRAGFRQGESPADALLLSWGQKNHSVAELFKLLFKMKHYQVKEPFHFE